MVFSNYVRLEAGVPKRLHFTDWYSTDRDIMDRQLGKPVRKHTEVFYVDEEDGERVSKTFSIMSEKLWAVLVPYTPNNVYRDYDFIITAMGDGFYKDWNVQVIKRPV